MYSLKKLNINNLDSTIILALTKREVVVHTYSSPVLIDSKSDILILGLFQADKAAPPYNLFTFLTHVQEAFEETEVDGNLMKQFQSGLSTSDYFTYSGSTTHSPYSENVTWFVMRDPLPIQPAQVILEV